MCDEKLIKELKKFPCPKCDEVGNLECHHMTVKVEHLGQEIVAVGEGWICRSCNTKFMSDDLTESIVNQVSNIDSATDGVARQYIEINRSTGEMKGHAIN